MLLFFHNIFNISLTSGVQLHTCTYHSIYFFLNSANLICEVTVISKYFRESLGLRHNESRLHCYLAKTLSRMRCLTERFGYLLITKTCLYNFDPLKPHFYIVKLGFTGVYIIFLISAQKIDCGYSLEPPR